MNRVIGSGVLPLAIHDGQIYILLGRESNHHESNNTWCGFGGGIEKGESIVDNAIREFMEESMAIIMSKDEITDILTNNKDGRLLTRYQLERDDSNNLYVEHVILIAYDDKLPDLFDRVHRQFYRCSNVINRSCKVGQCNIIGTDIGKTCAPLFEKDKIDWFKLDDLIYLARNESYDQKVKLRPCFADMILAAEQLIKSSIIKRFD